MASDSYLDPYRAAERTHGSGFGVTLWASPATQTRRFEVMTRLADLEERRILDAGCGRGDFASFLRARGIGYRRFIGLDGVASVIKHAHERDLPRAEFRHADVVSHPEMLRSGDPDVICISGTLNTMTARQAEHVLEAAWEATNEALLFNFLSDRAGAGAPPQLGPARRLPTLELLDWAMERTWCTAFLQDYFAHGHDATIAMHKPKAVSERMTAI